jgi:transposase
VVVWLDEMGSARMRRRAALGAGRPDPVIKGTGKRFGVNMIRAIANAGMLRFRLFPGRSPERCSSASFAGCCAIARAGRVHLIVDGHPVHRSRLVSAWVGRHADQIELHFLPGYRPELNPVELLNHDVKANAAGRRRPRSASELRDELHGYLRQRQRQPQVLVRFFDHPTTRYAAAS